VLADETFRRELESFVGTIRDAGRTSSLAQVLLKLTCPGVPDIYQGTELWDLSLVDPDNRRPGGLRATPSLARRSSKACPSRR
jgi:(1->4)-alpha-D-glucan 1-alpha-D-glucosylmutase